MGVARAYRIPSALEVSPGTLRNGLIGHWLPGQVGNVVIPDLSGKGNRGLVTASGTRVSTDAVGAPRATFHDSVTGKVDCGTAFTLTFPLSMSAWVRPFNYAMNQKIFSKRDSFINTSMVWQLDLAVTNGNVRFGHGITITIFSIVVPLNRWTHIVVTADGATDRLYINGSLMESLAAIAALGTGVTAGVAIGAKGGETGELFAGSISAVRAYNRVLNEGEIKQIYRLPLTRPYRAWFVDGAAAAPTSYQRNLMGVGLGIRLLAASELREPVSRRKLAKLVAAICLPFKR